MRMNKGLGAAGPKLRPGTSAGVVAWQGDIMRRRDGGYVPVCIVSEPSNLSTQDPYLTLREGGRGCR